MDDPQTNKSGGGGRVTAAVITATAVAAFVGAILGSSIGNRGLVRPHSCPPTLKQLDCADATAKYVLYIGDRQNQSRVTIKDKSAFYSTITNLTTAHFSDLDYVDKPGDSPTPVPTPRIISISAPGVISFVSAAQQTNQAQPCSQHVTQKVGVNTSQELQQVLDQLSLQ